MKRFLYVKEIDHGKRTKFKESSTPPHPLKTKHTNLNLAKGYTYDP